jgi:Ca2+:H+ antiporter
VSTGVPERRGFDLRRFLLSGSGWPYLLVPFIPAASAQELAHAGPINLFITAALGEMP